MISLPLKIARKWRGSFPMTTLTWTGAPLYFWSILTAWRRLLQSHHLWHGVPEVKKKEEEVYTLKVLVSFPEAGGNGERGSMDWFDTDLPDVEYVLLLACSFIWIQHQVAVSSIKLPIGFWVYFSRFQILNAPHLTQENNSSNNTQQCSWSLKSICTVFVCIRWFLHMFSHLNVSWCIVHHAVLCCQFRACVELHHVKLSVIDLSCEDTKCSELMTNTKISANKIK